MARSRPAQCGAQATQKRASISLHIRKSRGPREARERATSISSTLPRRKISRIATESARPNISPTSRPGTAPAGLEMNLSSPRVTSLCPERRFRQQHSPTAMPTKTALRQDLTIGIEREITRPLGEQGPVRSRIMSKAIMGLVANCLSLRASLFATHRPGHNVIARKAGTRLHVEGGTAKQLSSAPMAAWVLLYPR